LLITFPLLEHNGYYCIGHRLLFHCPTAQNHFRAFSFQCSWREQYMWKRYGNAALPFWSQLKLLKSLSWEENSLSLQALRQSKGHSNHQIVAKDRSKEVSFEFSSPSTIGSMNCDSSFSSKRGGVFISFTKVDLPSRYHIISSNDSSGVRWRIE